MKGLGLRRGQESWQSIPAPQRCFRQERKLWNKVSNKLSNKASNKVEAEGFAEGEKAGEERGESSGRAAVAKALRDKGVGIDIIAETSGLSVEEIDKL